MTTTILDYIPDWVKYMHQIAKDGAGDNYGRTHVRINITAADKDLFPAFREVSSVFLVYAEVDDSTEYHVKGD